MKTGDKLKYVRGLRGMTLNDLHTSTGLSMSYISDVENGKSQMSIKSLTKVSKALSVSVGYLIDENAVTMEEVFKAQDYSPPDDIVEFFTTQKSLPYAVLAKDLAESKIDPEFLRDLIETIKRNQK